MSTANEHLPYPPVELMRRVGSHADTDDGVRANFDDVGRVLRQRIDEWLPADWSWEGRTLFDFGCGSGRLLRQFLDVADGATLLGSDIDAPSIAWIEEHHAPRIRAVCNEEIPPLPFADASVDVITATSVFTHLSYTSADWLVELHRMLRPGGYLLATVLNRGSWRDNIPHVEWDDDSTGMLAINELQPWSEGGPTVFLSEWWVRARWGRIFEVMRFEPEAFFKSDETRAAERADPGASTRGGQGAVLLRKLDVEASRHVILTPQLHDPRESFSLARALDLSQQQLHTARPIVERALEADSGDDD